MSVETDWFGSSVLPYPLAVHAAKELSQPNASFVQLGLRIPDRMSGNLGDFPVIVTLDIVEGECCFVTTRQRIDSGLQVNPI